MNSAKPILKDDSETNTPADHENASHVSYKLVFFLRPIIWSNYFLIQGIFRKRETRFNIAFIL